jgi:glycosyltransferase involved in cell wall biosynthesis
MTSSSIPCAVTILTRNSEAGLRRCLSDLGRFSEVIVADGGSTDGTRELAAAWGATVIHQPSDALDDDGTLIDYSAARNAAIHIATQPWVLTLDSDERLSAELVSELAHKLSEPMDDVDALELPFRYVIRGQIVDTATTYPGHQIRVFRNHLRYQRPVHEAVDVDPTRVGRLESVYFRYPPAVTTLVPRWLRYGMRECSEYDNIRLWWRGLGLLRLHRVKWLLRAYRRIERKRGLRSMPLRYELARPITELSLVLIDVVVMMTRWARRRMRQVTGTSG